MPLPLKKKIRKEVLAARDLIPAEERSEKSLSIEARLFELPEFKTAGVILFFASFRSEVQTGPMIRRALAAGKRVILPRVNGDRLNLFEIFDFDHDTAPGSRGIPEPRIAAPVQLGAVNLIVIPGAAFDEQGNRAGYGAGFYDKLLSTFAKATVALAFESQIVPCIPAERHDIPVQKIVTEKRVVEAHAQ
jgi:5-formyltetrahydrofolate cyclo-ligase